MKKEKQVSGKLPPLKLNDCYGHRKLLQQIYVVTISILLELLWL